MMMICATYISNSMITINMIVIISSVIKIFIIIAIIFIIYGRDSHCQVVPLPSSGYDGATTADRTLFLTSTGVLLGDSNARPLHCDPTKDTTQPRWRR